MNDVLDKFFAYPLRIFSLNASFFAVFAALGLIFFTPEFVTLHQFLFTQSFFAASFAAFLLTAMPVWCEVKSSLKPVATALFSLLWLAVLAEVFFDAGEWVMSLWWLAFACLNAFWMLKARLSKHTSIALLLFGVFTLTLLDAILQKPNLIYAILHLYALGVVVIAFRISVTLGNEPLKEDFIFLPNPVSKNITCFLLALLAFATAFETDPRVEGLLALSVSLASFSRLSEWLHKPFLTTHYTLILFLLYFALALSYGAVGVMGLLQSGFFGASMHLLNIAVLLGVVLLVFNTASLRHTTNQRFCYTAFTRVSFGLLFAAGIWRFVVAQLASNAAAYIHAPALLVAVVFGYFIVKFAPIFAKEEFFNDED